MCNYTQRIGISMNTINVILQWDGWIALNAIGQILLSISAFLTIYISLKQIGNGYRAKVYSELIIEYKNGKKVNCGVEITNIGMSHLFIKHVYLVFLINNRKERFTIHLNKNLLSPGESIDGYLKENVFLDILSEKNIKDKVYVCIETSAKKRITEKMRYYK